MPETFDFDIFLRHSAKDKAVVRPLAERLRRDGSAVKAECNGQMAELLHSTFFLHPSLEADTFRFRDPLNQQRRFIPLWFNDAPIKGYQAQFLHAFSRQ